MPLPTPTVHIDWDDDGVLLADDAIDALYPYTIDTGPDGTIDGSPVIESVEEVTARVLPGLSAERGRNQIKSLSPPLANDLQGALNNASGDYGPDNTSSPLYPNVDAGRLASWAMTTGTATHDVVRVSLDQVAPDPDWNRRAVGFAGLSQLARLVRKDGFSSQLYGDGTTGGAIRVDEAMHVLFDLAEIPLDRRAFDACQTRLLWFWVRPTAELFDLAIRLWASEGPGARLYDGADGITYLTSRHAPLTDPRSVTVQETFRDTATEPFYVGWEPDAGEQNVVNVCSVAWQRRAVDAVDAVIWSYGATVTLAAGEARAFRVAPTSDDPIASVVTPAAGTDYTLTAGSLASASFDRTSGPFVTWTPVAGAGGATLTGLQVRGKLARVAASSQVVNTIDTQASIDRYGPKPYTLPTLPDVDALVLQDFTNAVVSLNQWPRPVRTIEVPLLSDALTDGALAREPGDRVRVVNDREGFDREMVVEYVRVEWPTSGAPRAYLGCEAVVDQPYARWGSALFPYTVWSDVGGTTPGRGVWGY